MNGRLKFKEGEGRDVEIAIANCVGQLQLKSDFGLQELDMSQTLFVLLCAGTRLYLRSIMDEGDLGSTLGSQAFKEAVLGDPTLLSDPKAPWKHHLAMTLQSIAENIEDDE
jgi:hypothetical protein